MSWRQDAIRRFYTSRPNWVDGTEYFHRLCASVVPRDGSRILEVGAGPNNATTRFLSTLGEVHGVDPGEEVLSNEALASAAVIREDVYPFTDCTFDAVVSNYVVEHVVDPRSHLREIWRVLKPGGAYAFRTPNRWHYVAVVSAATPHAFHRLVANRLRALPSEAHEPWPTVYRMNSRRAIERIAQATGFSVERIEMVEKEPSYGMALPLLFFPFMAYERTVNATEMLAGLRANIFAVLRKRKASSV